MKSYLNVIWEGERVRVWAREILENETNQTNKR